MEIIILLFVIVAIIIYCMSRPSKETSPINIPLTVGNKSIPCVEEYWTLTEFAKRFDRMKVGDCTNHTTGEVFKCCIFIKDNSLTFVSFHNSIGVLSKEEIAKRKDNLKVGRTVSSKYCLYEGKETFAQPVNLGIEDKNR